MSHDTPTLRWDEITPDEHNVRLDSLNNVEELAMSIAEVGVLSPLAINKDTFGKRGFAHGGLLLSKDILFFNRLALGFRVTPGALHHMHCVCKLVVEVLHCGVLDRLTMGVEDTVAALVRNIKIEIDVY